MVELNEMKYHIQLNRAISPMIAKLGRGCLWQHICIEVKGGLLNYKE
jgi:hypothetical protein